MIWQLFAPGSSTSGTLILIIFDHILSEPQRAKLSLVLVAIFAFTFLGERPSLREWSGISMVAACVLLLAFKP